MANTNEHDGSINLSVNIDTSEIKDGTNKISGIVNKTVGKFKQVGDAISKALGKGTSQAANTTKANTDKMQKEYQKLLLEIEKIDNEITRLMTEQTALQTGWGITELGDKMVLPDSIQAQWEAMGVRIDELSVKLKLSKEQADQLKIALAGVDTSVPPTGGAGGKGGADGANKWADALGAVGGALKKVGKRIAGIIKSALIFRVIYKVMQSIMDMFKKILMSDEEFRQDWEEMKAAFYAAAQPLVNTLIPVMKWIVQQLKEWAISLGKVEAAIQGISYSEFLDQAKASKETADNYENVANSAEKAKRALAGFDDIEILSAGETDDSVSPFESLKEYDTGGEKGMLADLMIVIGGALAAVGVVLLFNGQVQLGLAFIIAGAGAFAISQVATKEFSTDPILNTFGKVAEIIADALLAVGLILLTYGQVKWGLAFIIAGALVWVAKEVVLGKFSEDPIVDTVAKIMMIAGGAALAIGLIMMVFGFTNPVSISLVAAGAVALVTGASLGSGDIVEALRGTLGVIVALVSGALLAIGIILCFTGVALPLGIALIAAGALGLVAVVAVNWNAIADAITGAINAVIDWVKTYGLLVLGIILCLTGAGMAFGIALILKWAKDNAGKVELASKILEMVQSVWKAVKGFWDSYIAPIFTADWWLNLGKNCINGLIAGFEGGINGIIGAFETMINWIVGGLNKISFDIPDWLGGGTFGINIPEANFGRLNIPRLAKGGVIPANREFLAVLGDQKQGTNIETPLETMIEAFNEALNGRNDTVKEEKYFLGETELMRIVYKLAKQGERIQGADLVV